MYPGSQSVSTVQMGLFTHLPLTQFWLAVQGGEHTSPCGVQVPFIQLCPAGQSAVVAQTSTAVLPQPVNDARTVTAATDTTTAARKCLFIVHAPK
jgi:hypothetical protein